MQRVFFNVEELADYTGFSKSYIYKLVHSNIIPYSKPNGKTLFFEKS
ncbi:helix-turn-helix domain-containing protein [Chryseobacterium wanjuense]